MDWVMKITMNTIKTSFILIAAATVFTCNGQTKVKEPYYTIDFNIVLCHVDIKVNDISIFSMESRSIKKLLHTKMVK